MRRWRLILVVAGAVFAFGAAGLSPPSAWARSSGASREDRDLYRELVTASKRGEWTKASGLARKADDSLAPALAEWLYLTDEDSTPAFDELTAFLDAHPAWPYRGMMLTKAEQAIAEGMRPATIVSWFGNREPRTGDGAMRLGEAKLALGNRGEGEALLRRAWAEKDFTPDAEKRMVAEHGALLQGAPTDARISRLLWLRRTGDATKLLDGADSDTREIAKARLALIARPQRINEVMADVRSGLRSDSGLLFEQARASRLNGDIREAVPFALKAQGPAGSSASKWWAERQVLAREALQRGLYQEAYDVTAAHGLTSGPDYADAEWLAGWIALRFLDKPGRAAEHFTALFKAVSFPVSKARGAYWTGRAYEAAHHPADAATFYDTAASYETTYYGQLAQARLRQARATLALPPAGGRIADEPSFTKSELARATRLATATGSESVIRPFFMALGEAASTADEYRFAGNLANELGYPGLAVRIGKKALQDNIVLTDIAYPVLSVPKASDAPEAALVLGLTRQESEFDERAESPAGARGLMQLMPATAKHVAKQEHLRYDPAKLEDAGYNMRLGMAYLAGLIDRFNGSYPLAIASYNAGPTNTRRWMEDYGDPRDPNVDPVDWVEKIPFSETRNYVQRVLENTQVYRSRLAKGPVPVRIHEDLARPNAPKAFGDDLTAYLGRGSSTEVASAADVPVPEPVTSTPPAREASKVEPPKAAALADATPPAKPVEIASAAPTATAPMTASEPPLPAPPQALAPAPAAPPGKPSHILAPAPKPEPPAKSASKKEKAPAPKLAAKTKKKAPVDENEEAASAEQPVSTGRPTGTPFGNGQPETRDTPAKCARMILDLNGKTRCADRQALND